MDSNDSAIGANVLPGQPLSSACSSRVREAEIRCNLKVAELRAQMQGLEERMTSRIRSSPRGSEGRSELLQELLTFLQRNARRLLQKILYECRPSREQVSSRNSVRQLLRKSEKANCSFFTLRQLVGDVLGKSVDVKVYPAPG